MVRGIGTMVRGIGSMLVIKGDSPAFCRAHIRTCEDSTD